MMDHCTQGYLAAHYATLKLDHLKEHYQLCESTSGLIMIPSDFDKHRTAYADENH